MLNHIQTSKSSQQSLADHAYRRSNAMTMHATTFIPGMMSSVATSQVAAYPAGSFESPFMSRVAAPSCSVSAPPPSSSGAITTSGSIGRGSAVGVFYGASNSSLGLRHLVPGGGGDGNTISGSGLHALLPTYGGAAGTAAGTTAYGARAGLESLFGAGCGGGGDGSLAEPAATFPAGVQQAAGGHLAASDGLAGACGGGSSTSAAESSYLDAAAALQTSIAGDGPYPHLLDTMQPTIYRRPFTGAKPPYSYISLITMAIQVNQ